MCVDAGGKLLVFSLVLWYKDSSVVREVIMCIARQKNREFGGLKYILAPCLEHC